MRRLLLTLGVVVGVLVPGAGASAYWRTGGTGVGSGAAVTMPTGATPTTSVSGRAITVSWAQNAFVGSTLGARGGGYTLTRYAEGSTTAVTPATSCSGLQSGTAATLSCTESNVPYGRWQYRVTPSIDSFTGMEGPASAVAPVVLAAPVLDALTPANPAAGATNGPIAVSWSESSGATGYHVFRRPSGGTFDFATPLSGATPLTTTSFSDTTATGGATYDYVVRAVAGPPTATSASSNQRSAQVITRPAAPAGAVTASAGSGGTLSVAWTSVAGVAGYNVFRRASTTATFDYTTPLNGATPVAASPFRDTTATPGVSYVYVVRSVVTGAGGTQVQSVDSAQSTSASCTSSWIATGAASSPSDGFRLEEASGTTAVNAVSSTRDGVYSGGVTLGQPGAIRCDPSTAVALNGSTGFLGAATGTAAVAGPNTFSVGIWFKTTVAGGKLVGFGNQRTTQSSQYDRHIYMTNAGKLVFGVYPGAVKTVTSAASYADGAWHMAVATLGSAGMRLYVDGAEVGADATVTSGEPYNGYWRAGWDNLSGWTDAPTNAYFTGTLDELGVFPTQLSATTVAALYASARP